MYLVLSTSVQSTVLDDMNQELVTGTQLNFKFLWTSDCSVLAIPSFLNRSVYLWQPLISLVLRSSETWAGAFTPGPDWDDEILNVQPEPDAVIVEPSGGLDKGEGMLHMEGMQIRL